MASSQDSSSLAKIPLRPGKVCESNIKRELRLAREIMPGTQTVTNVKIPFVFLRSILLLHSRYQKIYLCTGLLCSGFLLRLQVAFFASFSITVFIRKYYHLLLLQGSVYMSWIWWNVVPVSRVTSEPSGVYRAFSWRKSYPSWAKNQPSRYCEYALYSDLALHGRRVKHWSKVLTWKHWGRETLQPPLLPSP